MGNTKYEIMYIIRPNINEGAKAALVERFDVILKDNGTEVTEPEDREKRRLTYEMNGYREGICHTVKIFSPSSINAVNEFDRLAKINDDIIRYTIIKEEA